MVFLKRRRRTTNRNNNFEDDQFNRPTIVEGEDVELLFGRNTNNNTHNNHNKHNTLSSSPRSHNTSKYTNRTESSTSSWTPSRYSNNNNNNNFSFDVGTPTRRSTTRDIITNRYSNLISNDDENGNRRGFFPRTSRLDVAAPPPNEPFDESPQQIHRNNNNTFLQQPEQLHHTRTARTTNVTTTRSRFQPPPPPPNREISSSIDSSITRTTESPLSPNRRINYDDEDDDDFNNNDNNDHDNDRHRSSNHHHRRQHHSSRFQYPVNHPLRGHVDDETTTTTSNDETTTSTSRELSSGDYPKQPQFPEVFEEAVERGLDMIFNTNAWACTTASERIIQRTSGGGGGGGGGGVHKNSTRGNVSKNTTAKIPPPPPPLSRTSPRRRPKSNNNNNNNNNNNDTTTSRLASKYRRNVITSPQRAEDTTTTESSSNNNNDKYWNELDSNGNNSNSNSNNTLQSSLFDSNRSDVTGASTQVATNRAVDVAMKRIHDIDNQNNKTTLTEHSNNNRLFIKPKMTIVNPSKNNNKQQKIPPPMHSLLSESSNDDSHNNMRNMQQQQHYFDNNNNNNNNRTMGRLGQHVDKNRPKDPFQYEVAGGYSAGSSLDVEINGEITHQQSQKFNTVTRQQLSVSSVQEEEPGQEEEEEEEEEIADAETNPLSDSGVIHEVFSRDEVSTDSKFSELYNDQQRISKDFGPVERRTFRVIPPPKTDTAPYKLNRSKKTITDNNKQSDMNSRDSSSSCMSPPMIVRKTLSTDETKSPDPVFCSKSVSVMSGSNNIGRSRSFGESTTNVSFGSDDALFMNNNRKSDYDDNDNDDESSSAESESKGFPPVQNTHKQKQLVQQRQQHRVTPEVKQPSPIEDEEQVISPLSDVLGPREPVQLPSRAQTVIELIRENQRSGNENRSIPYRSRSFTGHLNRNQNVPFVSPSQTTTTTNYTFKGDSIRRPAHSGPFNRSQKNSKQPSRFSLLQEMLSRESSDNAVEDSDQKSMDVKSIRSAFESSVQSPDCTDDGDDDTASVKSLRERFEGSVNGDLVVENGIDRMRALFEVKRHPSAKRFDSEDLILKDAFHKFEGNTSSRNNYQRRPGSRLGVRSPPRKIESDSKLVTPEPEQAKSEPIPSSPSARILSVAERIRAFNGLASSRNTAPTNTSSSEVRRNITYSSAQGRPRVGGNAPDRKFVPIPKSTEDGTHTQVHSKDYVPGNQNKPQRNDPMKPRNVYHPPNTNTANRSLSQMRPYQMNGSDRKTVQDMKEERKQSPTRPTMSAIERMSHNNNLMGKENIRDAVGTKSDTGVNDESYKVKSYSTAGRDRILSDRAQHFKERILSHRKRILEEGLKETQPAPEVVAPEPVKPSYPSSRVHDIRDHPSSRVHDIRDRLQRPSWLAQREKILSRSRQLQNEEKIATVVQEVEDKKQHVDTNESAGSYVDDSSSPNDSIYSLPKHLGAAPPTKPIKVNDPSIGADGTGQNPELINQHANSLSKYARDSMESIQQHIRQPYQWNNPCDESNMTDNSNPTKNSSLNEESFLKDSGIIGEDAPEAMNDVLRVSSSDTQFSIPSFQSSNKVIDSKKILESSPAVIKPVARKPYVEPVAIKPVLKPVPLKALSEPSSSARMYPADIPYMNEKHDVKQKQHHVRILHGDKADLALPSLAARTVEPIQNDEIMDSSTEVESEFSDGVTLDVSIADVSNLTNPTALLSKTGHCNSVDGHKSTVSSDDERTKSIDLIDSEAKRSEASSSQTSEAAAPLIAKALRNIPMSDEFSTDSFFRARAAFASKSSDWHSRGKHGGVTDQKSIAEEKEREVNDDSWDVRQVDSLFPVKSTSPKEQIFEFDSDWQTFSNVPDTTSGLLVKPLHDYPSETLNTDELFSPVNSRSKTPTRGNRSRRTFIAEARRVAAFGAPKANITDSSATGNNNFTADKSLIQLTTAQQQRWTETLPIPPSTDNFDESKVAHEWQNNNNPTSNPRLASVMARLQTLKESRQKRAAAVYNTEPDSTDDVNTIDNDDFSSSTKSSTRFGGSTFLASLEVD